MNLTHLTALELGRAIAAGDVTIPQATKAALEEITRRDQRLSSCITVLTEQAMERAETLQKGLKTGLSPLYGVPLLLKDNLCTQGIKTTCGSRLLEGYVPPYDATVVEKVQNAGGVCLGKGNLDEFAMGSTTETSYFGPTRNPWDESRVPGGSSGGCAAGVAAGFAWYALGSDTGGSIRQPAGYCGLTGLKPTYGTVSRYGLVAYASSLDQVGPLCRDAADCAAVLDLIQGKDRRDSTTVDGNYGGLLASLNGDIRGLRVGLPVECFGEGLDPCVAQRVQEVAKVLQHRGAILTEVSIPELKQVIGAYYVLASAEASSNLARYDGVKYGFRAEKYKNLTQMYENTRSQGFGKEAKLRILLGTFVLSAGYYEAYYKKALAVKYQVSQGLERAFAACDVLLTPVTPNTAPKLGESLRDPMKMYLSDLYTVPANLAGLPALSMPCGVDGQGLPVGAQLMGPKFGEQVLLSVAHAYQQETDHHKRVPRGGEGR